MLICDHRWARRQSFSINLQPLNHNSGRSTPAITYRRDPFLSDLERVHQVCYNSRPRHADGVPQADGPAVHVHLGGVDVQELLVGEDDDAERLVDLPEGDVVLADARLLEEGRDGHGGGQGKVYRVGGAILVGHDPRERFYVESGTVNAFLIMQHLG